MSAHFHDFPPPLDAMLASISSLPRAMLSRLVDQMIDRMDQIDGDPDVELNGDETDSSHAEDDFCDHSDAHHYPGCPVSDPDCCVTDAPHDKAEEGDWEADPALGLPTPHYGVDQSAGPLSCRSLN